MNQFWIFFLLINGIIFWIGFYKDKVASKKEEIVYWNYFRKTYHFGMEEVVDLLGFNPYDLLEQVAGRAKKETPILLFPVKDDEGMCISFNGTKYYIVINARYLCFPKEHMEGCMAHEMAHIVNGCRWPIFRFIAFGFYECRNYAFIMSIVLVLFGHVAFALITLFSAFAFALLFEITFLILAKVRQYEEYKADETSIDFTSAPWSFVDWMEDYAKNEELPETWYHKIDFYFTHTHPPMYKRIERLVKILKNRGIPRPEE